MRLMPHAATFEAQKFAAILKSEVEDLATKRYGGQTTVGLGKAFAFWCIKNISPSLTDEQAELARSICEGEEPGDKNIDGAWIDKGCLYLLQAKYSPPTIPATEEDDFKLHAFGADPAEEIEAGFQRVRGYYESAKGTPSRKLIQVTEKYRQALKETLRVELVVAISGKSRKQLKEYTKEINASFRRGKGFEKHFCSIYDFDELNQIVSDNFAPPPKMMFLTVGEHFLEPNPDGSIYALAATVEAKEMIRIRSECGYNLYHSNFRFLLTRGGVARPKIEQTIKDPTEKLNFWRYNNGITICCESLKKVADRKYEIEKMQVVNGLQTIETLYDNRGNERWTDDVKLLVRVIPTRISPSDNAPEKARILEEHIAEYSNSQTPITPRNLRANDPIQQEIDRILSEVYGLKYIRKVGWEPALRGRPSAQRIDNEEAAQASLSFWHGLSFEAKTRTRLLFEKETSAASGFYEKVFNEGTTAEYVLLPYLFWDNQYLFIKTISNDYQRGAYRNLDLMAVAVVGDAFKDVSKIGPTASRAEEAINTLKLAIENIRNLKKKTTKELWKPIMEGLLELVEERRSAEAKRTGKSEDMISIRNVVVKMRYTDPEVMNEIGRKVDVDKLRKTLKDSLLTR
jgi:hypothetical protein